MDYPTIIPLAPQDAMFGLYTHKVVVDYALLVARGGAATAVTLQLFPAQTPSQHAAGSAPSGSNPVGLTARNCALRIITNFDGGATSNLTVTVGDGGDVDRLLTSTSIHEDSTEIPAKAEGAVTQPYSYPVADTIDAVFTSTGANLDALTAGEVEIYIHLSMPPTRA